MIEIDLFGLEEENLSQDADPNGAITFLRLDLFVDHFDTCQVLNTIFLKDRFNGFTSL